MKRTEITDQTPKTSNRTDRLLTDKSVYRDQPLAAGIDSRKQTLESDSTEQSRTFRRNKARRYYFDAIEN